MKVLMFGWEFPPQVSGGLGVACYGIVHSLLAFDIEIHLVLPICNPEALRDEKKIHYISALTTGHQQARVSLDMIDSLLQPYLNPQEYLEHNLLSSAALYGKDLWQEIQRYAQKAGEIAQKNDHDIIHAHEWLTILAGIEAKKMSGKPLIFHVHALESDRNPRHPNAEIQAIETLGVQQADCIMAVSQYTKNKLIQEYGAVAEKIKVIYNGHRCQDRISAYVTPSQAQRRHAVLFLGRITEQKGPYYFVQAAQKILSQRQDVEFIIAGEGDQLPWIIETCAQLGISAHVHFTGFLNRDEVTQFYEISDVYVMPSVSEPFGIVSLEAVAHGVPLIISKQSGVAEVLTHALTIDYWASDELAEKIMALLDYPALRAEMLPHAQRELAQLTWDAAAIEISKHYQALHHLQVHRNLAETMRSFVD